MKKYFKKTFKAYYVGTDLEHLYNGSEDGGTLQFVNVNVKNGNSKARYDYCKENYCLENYITIKAKRCSENDLYEYDGKNMSAFSIKQYLETISYKDYLKNFMEQNIGKQCYIYSNQWGKYWCDDGGGYTSIFENRGVYEVNKLNSWVGHCGGEKQIKFELIN